MNWDIIKGNWKQLRHKVKEEWSALTDEHIDRIAGQREQLPDKIQEFYGVSKDAADAQIDAFADRIKDTKQVDVRGLWRTSLPRANPSLQANANRQGSPMRIQIRNSPRLPMRVAGAALIAAGIVFCFEWIPASMGGESDATPHQLAAAPPGGDANAASIDLAILLDWHMNASSGYRSVLDGLSCAPRDTLAESQPAQPIRAL